MTATFTFRGDQTLSKVLELPVSVQDISEQFSIKPTNVFLIAETGQMKGRPIQAENANFLKLENGQKYEVVAASRDRCHFTYNGRTISVEPEKATPYYLGERFCLNSLTLRQGEKTLAEVNSEFKDLIVGETYSVEGDRKELDQLPRSAGQRPKTACSIKLKILVPPKMLESIEGALLADFQTNANIRKYIYLNKLFDHQADANVAAKALKKFTLRSEITEFRTFFSAVEAINDATEALFQDVHHRFDKIFINVMQLPRSLLDAIDVPNRFENNVVELREIMENTARTHINATVALLQTEIEAIVLNFQNPIDLASKLCTTVSEQLFEDGKDTVSIKTALESKERAHEKLKKERELLRRGKNAELERASFAENSYENAMQMPDELSQWTMRAAPPENFETGKDIKLIALLEFVDSHVLESLPDIKEIDEHKWVNQRKYEFLLSNVRSQEPFVQTFRGYVAFIAELSSATATDDDHTQLQSLHADLVKEAEKLHATLLKMDLNGSEKEKLAKLANCDKKVSVEKFQQYEQLIRQKKDEIARIAREIERKRQTHKHLSNELEALGSVNQNLKHMIRLFNEILTGLRKTKVFINTVLNQAIENFLQKMKLPVCYENEKDARAYLELWYTDAIRVIGWAVQIATSSLVFGKLYETIIAPGLERNTNALYCTGGVPQSNVDIHTAISAKYLQIEDAKKVIEELERRIPEDTYRYIQTIHKPLNVTIEALTQGEFPSDPEQTRLSNLN